MGMSYMQHTHTLHAALQIKPWRLESVSTRQATFGVHYGPMSYSLADTGSTVFMAHLVSLNHVPFIKATTVEPP